MRKRIVSVLLVLFFLLLILPSSTAVEFENDPLLWKSGARSNIWAVSTSSDGRYVAAGTFRLMTDVETDNPNLFFFDSEGNLLWDYDANATIWSVDVSSDGKNLVAGSKEKKLYFFDSNGNLLWEYTTDDSVWSVDISSDGRYVVAGSYDNNVYFFDLAGNLLWSYKANDIVLSTFISADNKYVVAGSYDNNVYFFDLAGNLLWSYKANDIVLSTSISSDGRYVVAGSYDNNVYFFDLAGNLLWKYTANDEIWDISLSSDGNFIAAGSKDNNVYFLNSNGELLGKYATGHFVSSVIVSSDGRYVVAGSYDKNVYFFDAARIVIPLVTTTPPPTSPAPTTSPPTTLPPQTVLPTTPTPTHEPPKLTIVRSITKSNLIEGDNATVYITLKNVGGSRAIVLSLVDIAPEGLGSAEIRWQGNIEPDTATTFSYAVEAKKIKVLEMSHYNLPQLDVIYADFSGGSYHAISDPIPITVGIEPILPPRQKRPWGSYLFLIVILIFGFIIFKRRSNRDVYRRNVVNFLVQIKDKVKIRRKPMPKKEILQFPTKNILYSDKDKSFGIQPAKSSVSGGRIALLKQLKRDVER